VRCRSEVEVEVEGNEGGEGSRRVRKRKRKKKKKRETQRDKKIQRRVGTETRQAGTTTSWDRRVARKRKAKFLVLRAQIRTLG
jgi:hypothetical protein